MGSKIGNRHHAHSVTRFRALRVAIACGRVREITCSRIADPELEQTAQELTPNDLSVVYVRPTTAGVKFTPLTVTDNGDFDAPWPEGFFDERDSELF